MNIRIRPITPADTEACGRILYEAFCRIADRHAPVFWQLNHAVAESTEDMQVLLSGAQTLEAQPLSFLLPVRQAELFRWCLSHGMKVIKPMFLMTMGEYQEPRGSYLPSVLY